MPTARRATSADIPTIASTFAKAFAEDPLMQWMAGLADTERRLEPFWRSDTRLAMRHDDHLVFLTDDGGSAAVWRGIDRWKSSATEGLALLPAAIRAFRFRLPSCIRLLMAMEKAHPTDPHYYLESLGTRQDRQGKGGGSALIGPMLDRCDAEGVPAYLESSNPRNIPFYARHGFVEREIIQLRAGEPKMTAMWREPKS